MNIVNRTERMLKFAAIEMDRVQAGFSVEKLSAEAGLSPRSYGFYKAGLRTPRTTTLRRLRRALGRLERERLDP